VAILIDSASPEDAAAAAGLGFVHGFTTNPTLMARVTTEPLPHFERLLAAFPHGPAFYQPAGATVAETTAEARAASSLAPDRVVIKLGATPEGVRAAAELRGGDVRCALTAAYAPAQALVAHEAGCDWVIPYVDRADRQSVGGLALVESFAAVLSRLQSRTHVLAASLKSAEQVVAAILHGAHDVTAPLEVLRGLPAHPLSDAAMREFAAAARR